MATERMSPRDADTRREGARAPQREAESRPSSPNHSPAQPMPVADQAPLADLLARTSQELSESRRQVDELRQRLEETQQQRFEEAKELAESKRRATGLQFKVDYLEEKLDQAKRELGWRRQPWWRRRKAD